MRKEFLSCHNKDSVRFYFCEGQELKEIKWHDQGRKSGEMDTYMDTNKTKRGYELT